MSSKPKRNQQGVRMLKSVLRATQQKVQDSSDEEDGCEHETHEPLVKQRERLCYEMRDFPFGGRRETTYYSNYHYYSEQDFRKAEKEFVDIMTRAVTEGKSASWVICAMAKSSISYEREFFVALARHFDCGPDWAFDMWEEYQDEQAHFEYRRTSFCYDDHEVDVLLDALGDI